MRANYHIVVSEELPFYQRYEWPTVGHGKELWWREKSQFVSEENVDYGVFYHVCSKLSRGEKWVAYLGLGDGD